MKVRLLDVRKEFASMRGKVRALDGINLKMEDGEFLVLLGPSGSGKSTVLNLLAGLEKPTAGEIWFGETLVASGRKKVFLSPGERNISFVFQSYALYPHLTVFENVAFPLRVRRTSKRRIRELVEKTASMLGISALLGAKPRELSGGQRQRVAIARAIVRQPDLFLLDEPLSNLDPQLRLSTRKELKDLQRRLGITTAYVTHDQAEAMSLGDRIAILKDGRLEQVGTPEELYAAPANTFVATFVGSPGMNIIETEVCEKDGAFCAALGGGKLEICPAQALKRENVPEHTCLLGVRPEHVRFNPPDPLRPIKARVEGAERFGRDTLVHVLARNVRLCVLTAQGGPDEGKDVTVEFDPDKIHIFDRHTGKRLEVRK